MRQEEINRCWRSGEEGHRVLRLKGGDPFIFGRGGEEIDTWQPRGSRSKSCPESPPPRAAPPIPGSPHPPGLCPVGDLRDRPPEGRDHDLNWDQLAQPNQTLVFYMGLVGLPIIVEKLIAHGVAKDMPIALVQQGTTHKQQVYTGTLSSILKTLEQDRPKPPTLIIVGEVVRLREKLSWFQTPQGSEQGATTPILPGS